MMTPPAVTSNGSYVDVARSVIAGDAVGTDVLNRYAGVVNVGVARSEFGRTVFWVNESEEKSAERDA